MLSGVGIICFAASYVVALALEVSRLFFRSGVRGAVMLGFAAAGLVSHTAFLYYRAVDAVGAPLSSQRDWYLLTAWVLVAFYLYLVWCYPRVQVGLFLWPLVLALIGIAALMADTEPFARGPASTVWGLIHGSTILLATVTMLVGFAAGLMYLWQARRLKRKRPSDQGVRLPSLEWLQRINARAIVLSTLLVAVTVASGGILNLINTGENLGRLPWSDPVVLATLLLLLWLVAATLISRIYRPVHTGRRVAWLTVASLFFLVLVLAMMLGVRTQHGGSRRHACGTDALTCVERWPQAETARRPSWGRLPIWPCFRQVGNLPDVGGRT